ncbi:MAG: hypothetical protein WCJ30_17020 [Deltaproteobacteria bacterium]
MTLCDDTGEGVDYESESAVYACTAERAIFDYDEHWQAGLSGSITIYPDDNAYRGALAAVPVE